MSNMKDVASHAEDSAVTNLRRQAKSLLQQAKTGDPIHVHAARFLLALREDNAAQAHALVESHPDLARYSIHTAAALGNAPFVQALLAANLALATQPTLPDGTEPIVYASHGALTALAGVSPDQRVETVRALLDAGASANACILHNGDANARIPALYFACVSNNVAVARLLLERGANPNDGESVYHAAERNHQECLELLTEFGADLSACHSHWGNTPLYFLAGYKTFSPLYESSEQGMQWLLEHGADPNVRSLVGTGPNGLSGAAETPLHRAAAYGKSADVAHLLVERGAVVDAPRGDGKTAYILAIRAGNLGVAEYLASVGADTSLVSPVDRLLAACIAADASAARAIVDSTPGILDSLTPEDRQALALAVEDDRDDRVRLMVDLGWRLTDEGAWGGTPLHHAAWHGRVAMTKVLLELGAPINVRDSEYGSSPLAWAAHGSVNGRTNADDDYVAVVKLLLAAGASRAESCNKWNEAPEQLASAEVARVIERAFKSALDNSNETEGEETARGAPNCQTPDR